jgi:hypothetical protein
LAPRDQARRFLHHGAARRHRRTPDHPQRQRFHLFPLVGITEHFGLREPLDGIVLGAAAGSGFFIYEPLVQYVPQAIDNAKLNCV